jgi:hypothetical protein
VLLNNSLTLAEYQMLNVKNLSFNLEEEGGGEVNPQQYLERRAQLAVAWRLQRERERAREEG